MQEEFSSNDVISLTGITARQLQWWDERGIVAPRHQGHRRIYNWDELVTVAVLCQLRRPVRIVDQLVLADGMSVPRLLVWKKE